MLKTYYEYMESGIYNDEKMVVRAAKAFLREYKGMEQNELYELGVFGDIGYMPDSETLIPDDCDFKFELKFEDFNDGGDVKLVGLRVKRN